MDHSENRRPGQYSIDAPKRKAWSYGSTAFSLASAAQQSNLSSLRASWECCPKEIAAS